MKVLIEFDTDNDAFRGNLRGEIRSVIKQAAEKLLDGRILPKSNKLFDSNGNSIGAVQVVSGIDPTDEECARG